MLLESLLDEAATAGGIQSGLNNRRIAGVLLQAIMFNSFASTISGSSVRSDPTEGAEELWGLRDEEGWATVGDEGGAVFLPLWPHAELAALCATDSWEAYRPEPIRLVELLAAWLPSLAEEGWGIAVFPTPAMAGAHVPSDELRADLERAIRGA